MIIAMYIYSAIKDRRGRLSQTGKHIYIGFELFNDWNLVVSSKCFQSLNNSSQKSHSKTAVFSRVKISKNLFSHAATLPTCPEKFDYGKYVTSTSTTMIVAHLPAQLSPTHV